MAVYGWARLVDELGDNYAGDRLAALDEAERQLRLALGSQPSSSGTAQAGQAEVGRAEVGRAEVGRAEVGRAEVGHVGLGQVHPLIAGVAALTRRRNLPTQPLFDLLEANRQDQRVARYETFEDLVGYCRLSANPVGRLVLGIFAATTPERAAWSDKICTALQLVEHWQDVAEDAIVGRVYVPQEDLRRFGASEEELVPPPTTAGGVPRPRASFACRALMAFEVARARRLLDEGAPLVGSLRGRLRVAVAAFVAGGHAALDALAATGFDIYAPTAHPAPRRFALHLAKALSGRRPVPAAGQGFGLAVPEVAP
jgi:squalene synthase HpnC